jgi:hypothetical protein
MRVCDFEHFSGDCIPDFRSKGEGGEGEENGGRVRGKQEIENRREWGEKSKGETRMGRDGGKGEEGERGGEGHY